MRGRDERGFSLIEVLIGLGIMSVIYLAVTQILVRVHLSHATMAATMSLRQEARVLLLRIGDEVRQAGQGIVDGVERVSYAGADQLTVALDLDRGSSARPCVDEAGDNGVEEITYKVATSRIDRSVRCWVGGGWASEIPFTPVAEDLAAASFQYFDVMGNELVPGGGSLSAAQREQVVRVRIAVAFVAEDRAIQGETTPNYQSSLDVRLRNGEEYLTRLVEGG